MPIAFRRSGKKPRVSATRLDAQDTDQRLIPNKASIRSAQLRIRSALFAAAVLGLAVTSAGCGSDKAVSALVKESNSDNQNSAEHQLPQGVIAPYQPVQPGDARLSPDGHYDYTAEDFVLRHPCDDQELMARLKEKGWAEWDGPFSKTDEPNLKGCVINSSHLEDAPILLGSVNPDSAGQENGSHLRQFDTRTDLTGYFGQFSNQMSYMCFYGFDTSHGVIGIFTSYGEYTEFQTRTEACEYLAAKHSTILGD